MSACAKCLQILWTPAAELGLGPHLGIFMRNNVLSLCWLIALIWHRIIFSVGHNAWTIISGFHIMPNFDWRFVIIDLNPPQKFSYTLFPNNMRIHFCPILLKICLKSQCLIFVNQLILLYCFILWMNSTSWSIFVISYKKVREQRQKLICNILMY